MIWIIDQSVLLMSLQTYPLGVQRLSQTLWWSGHPKAINKTLMLRHLLVLHPQQKHGYPKMIWKGYMTPFYHGRFGYSTHVISKQQHVGRYNKKKHSHSSKPSNPTRRILETPDPRTPVRQKTRRHNGGPTRDVKQNKASRRSFQETYSDCGVIFQELQMSPQRGHFNKKRILSRSQSTKGHVSCGVGLWKIMKSFGRDEWRLFDLGALRI